MNLPDSVKIGDLTGRLTDPSFRRATHEYTSPNILSHARQTKGLDHSLFS